MGERSALETAFQQIRDVGQQAEKAFGEAISAVAGSVVYAAETARSASGAAMGQAQGVSDVAQVGYLGV